MFLAHLENTRLEAYIREDEQEIFFPFLLLKEQLSILWGERARGEGHSGNSGIREQHDKGTES